LVLLLEANSDNLVGDGTIGKKFAICRNGSFDQLIKVTGSNDLLTKVQMTNTSIEWSAVHRRKSQVLQLRSEIQFPNKEMGRNLDRY